MIKGSLTLDPKIIRQDFPIFQQAVAKPLVYLDSAATSQRPSKVIDAEMEYYQKYNSNVHRGVYRISVEATEAYERAREKVARFINARSPKEIIFVRSTTEAINLISQTWGRTNIQTGDNVLLTEMEHHSNIVPWMMLCKEKGASLRYLEVDDDGFLSLDQLDSSLDNRSKLLAFTHASNVLGTINPAKEMIRRAHDKGALVVLDSAQTTPHMTTDVRDLDCDFMAFSGHKMLGPTGIGILYAREEILDRMEPFLYGGDMIKEVHKDSARWNDLPWKFEAGTPNIAGAIGLGAAIDYINGLGIDQIRAHERAITSRALDMVQSIPGITVYGPKDPDKRAGLISFNIKGVHAHDTASILDTHNVCIRAGHHCAQPLMEKLGVPATTRASFYVYNNNEDIDMLIHGIEAVKGVFKL
ncbi:MAG: cysteine desulfurase [Thaumarchaeota archaeon]|nr:cysteine desulfurase [Nitrososphaerota archaeon]